MEYPGAGRKLSAFVCARGECGDEGYVDVERTRGVGVLGELQGMLGFVLWLVG